MPEDIKPQQQPLLNKTKVIEPLPQPERPPLHLQAKIEDPSFKTPEETAAEETVRGPAVVEHMASRRHDRHRWLPHGRKQWAIVSTLVVLLLSGGCTAWILAHHTQPTLTMPKKVATKKTVSPPAPTPTYSTLSGLQITDASLNSKPVTAVMVENSLAARPQSGLSKAGVVFEAVAEGGVTRYMALYQDTAPSNVGPIRSARPYYIQWALGFDAAYAHVGGSPDALNDIKAWGVQDMNQFYNSAYYHRITSRYAPHNVYTGIGTLNQLETKKGYKSAFTGFPRSNNAAPLAQPTASSISLYLSGPIYDPSYVYNPTTNTYDRSEYGKAQIDANTGKQLNPTVVIAIVVPLSRGALDSTGAYYSDYNVIGNGAAYIFQNGGVTIGQWHKASRSSQITFTDAGGTAIPLNRGQTWITAVSSASKIAYKGAPASNTGN